MRIVFNNNMWRSVTLLFLIIATLISCNASLLAAVPGAGAAEVTELSEQAQQARIKDALTYTSFEDKTYDLVDALDELEGSTPSESTRTIFFQTLGAIFQERLKYYAATMGKGTDIADLSFLFFKAKDSAFLSDTQKIGVDTLLATLNIEELIFDSINTADTYDKQVTKLRSILTRATGKTFSNITQSIFFNNVTSVFKNRITQDPKVLPALKGVLTAALTTPLLTETHKIEIQKYLNSLNAEEAIRKAQALADYSAQIAAFDALQTESATKIFEPNTQIMYFNALTATFNARTTKTLEQAEQLHTLLTNGQKTPLLRFEEHEKVIGYVNALIPEKTIINAKRLTEYEPQAQAINTIATTFGTQNVTPTAQNGFLSVLQDLYPKRPVSNLNGLNQLLGILTKAVATNLLNNEQKNTVQTTMIAPIRQEIQNLTFQDNINKALAQPAGMQIAALSKIIDDAQGKLFDAPTQTSYNNGLGKVFDARSQEDANALKALQGLVNKSLTSPLLADTQKEAIKTNMLPVLAGNIEALGFSDRIKNALAQPDFNTKVNGLGGIVNAATGKTFPSLVQTDYNNALQGVVASRPRNDAPSLNNLKNLVNSSLTSPLLNNEQKQATQNALTPSIDKDLKALELQKRIRDALAIPDYNQRMAALQKIIDELAGQVLDPETQKLLADAIKNLFNNRPLNDPVALANLAKMADSLKDSSLLPEDMKTILKGTIIPNLAADQDRLATQNQLANLNNIPNFNDRIILIGKVIDKLEGKPVDPTTQKLISQGLKDLYEGRPLDPTILANLGRLLDRAKNNPAVDAATQQAIQNSLLPGVVNDQNKVATQGQLAGLDAVPNFNDRIILIGKVIDNLTGKPTDADTKQMLDNKLKDLADARPLDDPNALTNLGNLLNNIKNNPALNPATQQDIQNSLLPTIAADQNKLATENQLANLDSLPNFNDRIILIGKVIDGLAGKPINPDTQELLSQGLKDLSEARPLNDPSALANLGNLLNKTKNNPLLDPAAQQEIQNSLLPTVAADQNRAATQNELANINNLPNFNDRIVLIGKVIDNLAGKPVDHATQQLINQGLKDLSDARPLNDPNALANLGNLLNNTKNNPALDQATKQEIQNSLLPTVAADQNTLATDNQLANLNNLPNFNDKIILIGKVIDNLAGKPINADTQAMIAQGLKDLYDARPLDPAILANLGRLLDKIKNNPVLDANTQNAITTDLLPSVIADQKNAQAQQPMNQGTGQQGTMGQFPGTLSGGVGQLPTNGQSPVNNQYPNGTVTSGGMIPANGQSSINNQYPANGQIPVGTYDWRPSDGQQNVPSTLTPQNQETLNVQNQTAGLQNIPNLNDRIKALENIIQGEQGKPLTSQAQQILGQSLRDLYEARQLDPAILANLGRLLNKAQTSGVIDPATLQYIKTNLLPNLIHDQNIVAIHQQVQNADDQPDIDSQIAALQKAIAAAQGKPVDPQTQDLIALQLQDLYEHRDLDPATLANLGRLMNTMQQSPLVSPEAQQFIHNTVLPTLASDQEGLKFQQEIHLAMAQPRTVDRIDGVATVTGKYFNKSFSDRIQNLYALTLQTLFDERYATDIILDDGQGHVVQVPAVATTQAPLETPVAAAGVKAGKAGKAGRQGKKVAVAPESGQALDAAPAQTKQARAGKASKAGKQGKKAQAATSASAVPTTSQPKAVKQAKNKPAKAAKQPKVKADKIKTPKADKVKQPKPAQATQPKAEAKAAKAQAKQQKQAKPAAQQKQPKVKQPKSDTKQQKTKPPKPAKQKQAKTKGAQ